MDGAFFLTNWFLVAMKWVHSNIAAEYIVLTVIICTTVLRLITIPSDIKTRKSSAKMALIQPELQRLQKKYKDNPRKFQEAQKKLMRENGVSTWSSCLPLLITMPLFICFFNAFRYWGNEQMLDLILLANEDVEAAKEMFDGFKFLWVNNVWQADNGLKPVIAEAATFLSSPNLTSLLYFKDNPEALNVFEQLGMVVRGSVVSNGVLTETVSFVTSDAAIAKYNELLAPVIAKYDGYNNGWFLLPLLSAGLYFVSSKISMAQQPQPAAQSGNDAANPQQTGKMMTYMFPIISFIACLSNNAAFAIYWSYSSLLMIVVNIILNKKYPRTALVKTDNK